MENSIWLNIYIGLAPSGKHSTFLSRNCDYKKDSAAIGGHLDPVTRSFDPVTKNYFPRYDIRYDVVIVNNDA